MDSVPVVALVACVKSKGPAVAPARRLYTSPLFRASAAYAERVADRWFILSAEHELLHPDQQVAPYERTLTRMSVTERAAWAVEVLNTLRPMLSSPIHLVVLAGTAYRECLLAPLRDAGCSISVPMVGLRFGEQLRWLAERTRTTESTTPSPAGRHTPKK
ncbi:DUF6884 domain-containing protein [Tahibacter sp.]|uniref:DUF6884 domain-containing protein n=1 Tax=Tahibacter sp. TaxID=2056211 RepID=UPI0028C428A6|nr:DUF6884 domain-containing protein [Tahibacter sp.]